MPVVVSIRSWKITIMAHGIGMWGSSPEMVVVGKRMAVSFQADFNACCCMMHTVGKQTSVSDHVVYV